MPGPIPWTAINEWAKHNQVNGPSFSALVQVIQSIDGDYLAAYFEKQKAEINKSGRSRTRS